MRTPISAPDFAVVSDTMPATPAEQATGLSIQAAAVRARCERTAVHRCQVTFADKVDFGSLMPILAIGVRGAG